MKHRSYQQVALKHHQITSAHYHQQYHKLRANSIFDTASAPIFALLQMIYNQPKDYVASSVSDLLQDKLKAFEQELYKAGYPFRTIRFCQYCLAICADTILLSSEWGKTHHWEYHQLTAQLQCQSAVNNQLQQMLDYLAQYQVDFKLLNFIYVCVAFMAHCPQQQTIQWSQYHDSLYQALKTQQSENSESWFIDNNSPITPKPKWRRLNWPRWLKTSSLFSLIGLGYMGVITIWQYEQLVYAINLFSVS